MPTSFRAAYISFRSNRTRARNTWTLAEMGNHFLKVIGVSG